MYCKNLETVILPSGLREIHNNVFEYCTKLKSIKIPNTITAIGNATFSNWINLDSVYLPASVNFVGNYAFRNCTNLRTINLESVYHIEKYAFENKIIFVNYYPKMVNSEKGLDKKYTNDGVHPTLAGYKVMEPLVQEAILKVTE